MQQRLREARSYDRIAGFFCNAPLQCWDLIVVGFARIPQHTKTLGILANPATQNVLPQQRSGALFFSGSLIEVAGEELESVVGKIRLVCNSDLQREDVETARAAQMAVRRSWCRTEPEKLLDTIGAEKLQLRFRKLFALLTSGKLEVRVLPDAVFGLVHGKAGVILLADGTKTSFLGSVNESKTAWKLNYELLWEDRSEEAIDWVQVEFDARWGRRTRCRWPKR